MIKAVARGIATYGRPIHHLRAHAKNAVKRLTSLTNCYKSGFGSRNIPEIRCQTCVTISGSKVVCRQLIREDRCEVALPVDIVGLDRLGLERTTKVVVRKPNDALQNIGLLQVHPCTQALDLTKYTFNNNLYCYN